MAKNLLLLAVSILVAALGRELIARWLFPEWVPRIGTVTQFRQYDAKSDRIDACSVLHLPAKTVTPG